MYAIRIRYLIIPLISLNLPRTYKSFHKFTNRITIFLSWPCIYLDLAILLQCHFNYSSNNLQSNQRKWWKCLVSTQKLMKIQFLFPSNRQTSFSLSFAKGTDPHDQVQSQTLNSHEKCKIFLQDISVTKSHLILLLNTVFRQKRGLNLRPGRKCIEVLVAWKKKWVLDTVPIIKTNPDWGLLNRYWQTWVVGLKYQRKQRA